MDQCAPATSADKTPRRRRSRWKGLLLKVAVSVLLVAFVVWRLHRGGRFAQIGVELREVTFAWLAVAFLLQIVGTLFAALRWRVLLEAQGMHIPFRSLVNSYLVAAFFNTFLPGTYGGDVVRAYDSTKHTGEATRSVTVVILGRVAGLVALVGIALTAMAFNWRTVIANLESNRPLLWSLSALVAGLILFAALMAPAVQRLLTRLIGRGPLKTRLPTVFNSLAVYRRRPKHAAGALLVSVVFQTNVVMYFCLCTRALGQAVPIHRVMMAVPVVLVLVTVLPSVNRLGVPSAGFGAFLFGMTPDGLAAAASLEIVDHALRLAYGLVGGGAVFILRRRRASSGGP